MSDVAIKVENLSKKYYLGASANGNLRDTLAQGWNKLWGTATPNAGNKEFWALNDVSFEVKKGEVIGIIGRNGAGKSTLLKILSRITEPTTGRIELDGRVASLLEVGTGFHPELTGRENIFLNGSLLGMTRKEIKNKFDEIVDFSGVEEFIDTPVKKYSSGMYVRLAFAVAAHLEPEILLVDEVLAVGDFEFQKKCLGKMGEVARGGRTVLFVSHDMRAINFLCSRCILWERGQIIKIGAPQNTINEYLKTVINIGFTNQPRLKEVIGLLPKDEHFEFLNFCVLQKLSKTFRVENGEEFEIQISFKILKRIIGFRMEFDICDHNNTLLIKSLNDEKEQMGISISKGLYQTIVKVPRNILVGGRIYWLRVHAGIYDEKKFPPEEGLIIPIEMEETGYFNRKQFKFPYKGQLTLEGIKWKTKCVQKND